MSHAFGVQSQFISFSTSYKAALSNPRTSKAAREHARTQLELLEKYNEEQPDEHNNRVLGGASSELMVRGLSPNAVVDHYQASRPRCIVGQSTPISEHLSLMYNVC